MANEQNLIPTNKRSKNEVREIGRKGGIKSGEARREKAAMSGIWQKYFLDKISNNELITKDSNGNLIPLKWDDFVKLCLKESPIRTAKEAREATEGNKLKLNGEITVKTMRFE